VALSAFGEALLLNRAAKALLGVTGRDPIGRPIAEVVPEPAVAAALTDALQLPEPGARRDLEVRLGPEGAPRVLALSVVALPDAEGRVGGVAAAIRDVSYEKEVEQVKSDFVSGVSHELKTPLASIKAFAEILSDGEVAGTDEMRRVCTCIETEVDRLTRLINNLLNLSKIEAGIIKVTRTTFPAREVLEKVAQVLEPHASKRRQALRLELSEYLPSLTADRDMVEQMVINLVSNAVKYTPEGGSVWLRGKVAGRSLSVEVEDTGPGIAPEHQERVFDKFYRVPGERAAGTGLGLPLARRLARMHGGDIALTSQPGRGTCFRLTLPVGAAPPDQPTQEVLECARPS
jgi:PAS domain S-box-containing protein